MKINFKIKYIFFIIFLFVALISVGFSMWNIEGPGTGSIDSSVQTEGVANFDDYVEVGDITSFDYCALGNTTGFSDGTTVSDTGTISIPIRFKQTGNFTIEFKIETTLNLCSTDILSVRYTNGQINGTPTTSSNMRSFKLNYNITSVEASGTYDDTITFTFTIDSSWYETIATSGLGTFTISFMITQN